MGEAVRGARQADGPDGGAQPGGRGQAQQGQVCAQVHAGEVVRHQDGGHRADVRAVQGPVLGVRAQQHRPLGRGLQGPVRQEAVSRGEHPGRGDEGAPADVAPTLLQAHLPRPAAWRRV